MIADDRRARPTLAVYCFGFQLDKIRYPYLACIESALALADVVYYCQCEPITDLSGAKIVERFQAEYRAERLRILFHRWGDHHTIQAHIANFLLDHIGEQFDYALKLDMDEVLHEAGFDVFREDLRFMSDHGLVLGRPHYTHFSPDFDTTWPFIYESKAVISRTASGLRFFTGSRGDACALGGSKEYQTRLEVFHYGKVAVGREREALFKEVEFQKLYSHPEDGIGFPDSRVTKQIDKGYLDYAEVFEVAREQGQFHAFAGEHPVFMAQWIEESKLRSTAFWRTTGKSQSKLGDTT